MDVIPCPAIDVDGRNRAAPEFANPVPGEEAKINFVFSVT
jgi:hypothetical protein